MKTKQFDTRTKHVTGLIEKQISDNTYRFILSDGNEDRDGDTINPDGWDLHEFKQNPVALAFHDPTKIIGKWHNPTIKNGILSADLELAPDDVGYLQRTINKLISGGFLKAVSVGFRGLEYKMRDDGIDFLKQSLFEASVVAIPSNPRALAIAKSCKLEECQISKLFIQSSAGDRGVSAVLKAKQSILKANQTIRRKL